LHKCTLWWCPFLLSPLLCESWLYCSAHLSTPWGPNQGEVWSQLPEDVLCNQFTWELPKIFFDESLKVWQCLMARMSILWIMCIISALLTALLCAWNSLGPVTVMGGAFTLHFWGYCRCHPLVAVYRCPSGDQRRCRCVLFPSLETLHKLFVGFVINWLSSVQYCWCLSSSLV